MAVGDRLQLYFSSAALPFIFRLGIKDRLSPVTFLIQKDYKSVSAAPYNVHQRCFVFFFFFLF